MVIHDRTLRRTGLREGVVEEITAEELGQVDVGSWFNRTHRKLAQEEYPLQRVPLLDEVLESFDRSKAARLYVEIKLPRQKDSARELARTVVNRIAAHKLEDRTSVLSFDLTALDEVKRINPEFAIGILYVGYKTNWFRSKPVMIDFSDS